MVCPMKFNANTLDKDGAILNNTCWCEKEDCAWWNSDFEKCGAVLPGFLQGQAINREEHRKEIEAYRHDRR